MSAPPTRTGPLGRLRHGADRSPVAPRVLVRYARARSLCARALTRKPCLLPSSLQGCCRSVMQGRWALLCARRARGRPEALMTPVGARRFAARHNPWRCRNGPLIPPPWHTSQQMALVPLLGTCREGENRGRGFPWALGNALL